MAVAVRMPEVTTGSADAQIASWLVSPGDSVSVGQPIADIETEKATVEYEAEGSGEFAAILVEPGVPVAVGTVIAVLAGEGQSPDEALAEIGAEAEPSVPEEEERNAAGGPEEVSSPPTATPAASVGPVEAPIGGETKRLFASPLVRKLARERGLDVSGVKGTGPNGRIVRRDIEGLQAVPRAAESLGEDSAPAPAAAAAPTGVGVQPPPEGSTEIPHTGIRRAIARRLTESKSTVPHFYLVADCRMDELLKLRAEINSLEGIRVSVNDFIVKAVGAALVAVPEANAIWTEEATRRFDSVDISVAVSVPDGLLTPVVRGVEKLSLGALSDEIRGYAGRAREGKLKQHELEGGSFSVSNLGMYGTSEFSAILNPPQSGILAVGAAEKRPVVNSEGVLDVATVMTVTLSADHRVLDGAIAAEWLAEFKSRIENPMGLLI
jgi:pyruvate dehydrogenase E2 component (dihydrolipoamide acetyltransferase)